MIKKISPIFLLFFHGLSATITIPFTIDIAEGYREDHLKVHLQLPATPGGLWYEERYDPIKFAQTEITFRTVRRDIFFLANAGYGAFGRTIMKQGPFFVPFSNVEPSFHFKTKGEAFHLLGLLGYQVDLTPNRHYMVCITPLFGYAWYYEKIKRRSPSPNPFTAPDFEDSPMFFEMTSSLRKNLVTRWRGFFIGTDIQISPGEKVIFNITYAYHFMGLKQNIGFDAELLNFSSPGVVSSEVFSEWNVHVNTNGNHGHLGILKAEYDFTKKWGGIIFGKIIYLSSHMRTVRINQESTTTIPSFSEITIEVPTQYKLTHVILEILLQASYKF